MGWILLIAFIGVPIIEITLFISVGGTIGLWSTLVIVVLTAIAGTILVRSQSLRVLAEIRQIAQQSTFPAEQLVHGAMVIFSGALLLTPGFFTDAIGFVLLVPKFRHIAYMFLKKRIKIAHFIATSSSKTYTNTQSNDTIDLNKDDYHAKSDE